MVSQRIPVVLLHRSTERIRAIAARITSDHPDLAIVAEVSAPDEVPTGAVVLTDSSNFDGLDVVARVRRIRSVGARVIVIEGSSYPKSVVPAMAAGADAVIPTTSSTRRVTEQIRLTATRARVLNG
jgi:DNA-binding NarL/FixJ family response regulator